MKVLIVEDDPMVALINKRYLEDIGNIQVIGPVSTQEEIVEILETTTVNLILMDVYLPKKNGISILKYLRTRKYLVDVIMITAANSVEEVKEAFSYGIIDYLVKPFEYDRLKTAVHKYMRKTQLLTKKENVSQVEIDQLFSKHNTQFEELPKGLNARTFDKIVTFLTENSDEIWTLREIAKELTISNVTIKKYMDYLEFIKRVDVEQSSGNVGRPEMKYRIIK